MYQETREKEILTKLRFFLWMFISLLQSWGIFGISLFAYCTLTPSGRTEDLWAASTCGYFAIVLVHYLTLATFTRNWTLWMAGMYTFSFLLFAPLFILVYNSVPATVLAHRLFEITLSPLFWLVLPATVGASFLPVWFLDRTQRLLCPRLKDVLTTSPAVSFETVRSQCNSDLEKLAGQRLRELNNHRVLQVPEPIDFERSESPRTVMNAGVLLSPI